MKNKKVVILGAGPAGLYTGLHLAQQRHEVHIIEREDVVGGQCALISRNGNLYSHGFRCFHDNDKDFVEEIRGIVGPSWTEFDRSVRIKLQGKFYDYPLNGLNLLRSMHPYEALRCSVGFGYAMLMGPFRKKEPRNAEEAIVNLYGRPFYESIFRDYTTRFWDLSPSEISATFVSARLPRLEAIEKFKRVMTRIGLSRNANNGSSGVSEIAHPKLFGTPEGMGKIFDIMAERIQRRGGRIHLGTKACRITTESNRVQSVVLRSNGKEHALPCDILVSTIPINDLALSLSPSSPQEVRKAAKALGYRSLITTGCLVRKERVLDTLVSYFHGRSFHRLTEPKNSGVVVHPADHTVLLAETTCDSSDEIWHDPSSLCERVANDLESEELVKRDELQEIHSFRMVNAYPKFTVGFEKKLEVLQTYLSSFSNLTSTGRQGTFSFLESGLTMKKALSDLLVLMSSQ